MYSNMSVLSNNVSVPASCTAWNYNSVTSSLVTKRRSCSVPSIPTTPSPSHCLLSTHIPLSWTPSFRAFNFVIIPLLYFQDLLDATFWHSNFRNHGKNTLQTAYSTVRSSCCLNPLAPEFPFKFYHNLYLKCE